MTVTTSCSANVRCMRCSRPATPRAARRGTTTVRDSGRSYSVVIICVPQASAGDKLLGNAEYPKDRRRPGALAARAEGADARHLSRRPPGGDVRRQARAATRWRAAQPAGRPQGLREVPHRLRSRLRAAAEGSARGSRITIAVHIGPRLVRPRRRRHHGPSATGRRPGAQLVEDAWSHSGQRRESH